jgi:hypothetical protein
MRMVVLRAYVPSFVRWTDHGNAPTVAASMVSMIA